MNPNQAFISTSLKSLFEKVNKCENILLDISVFVDIFLNSAFCYCIVSESCANMQLERLSQDTHIGIELN